MSLLRILERNRLLEGEALGRVYRLQADKGYVLEEALGELGPAHARVKERAGQLQEEERRRRLNVAGLLRVFAELRSQPGALGVLLLLSAASALFSFPFVFSWYLGVVLQHLRYSRDMASLVGLTAVAAAVLVANTLLEFLLSAWAARCNFHLNRGLVRQCWQRLLHMPYPLYQRQEQGALLGKLTHVLEVLQKGQLQVLRNLPQVLCLLVVTAGALLSFHFAFILLFVPAVLLTYLVPIAISNQAVPHLRREPQALGRLSSFLQAAFTSHWLLRFKGLQGVRRRLEALASEHFLNQSRKWLAWNLSYNSKVAFNLLSFLTVLWGGGALYFAGSITLAELVNVYFLIALVTPRLDDVYRIYVGGQNLHASYEALDELLDAQVAAPAEPAGEGRPEPELGTIRSLRLERVSFRYRPGGEEVLREVDLELGRGHRYLVRGASGSGKSTLVDLLLGLLNPDSGRLLVNHQPLTPQARSQYWRRVSLQDQANFIFLGRSAEANLALPEAEAAQGEPWRRLADRLGLPLWGSLRPNTLSGGERQRLCLLRALARRADVYIFDEPTSALDADNAAAVMDYILSIPDAIVLVISHDPIVAERFDHIIHVSAGRAVLQGASSRPQERGA